MKKLLLFLALLWGGGAAGVWYLAESHGTKMSYRTVALKRGDLRATINATGTIEPEELVEVGAQVAGELQSFGTDPEAPGRPVTYGTKVEQGTLLARLDSALYQARVNQAKGGLAKAEADVEQARVKLRQAERELERTRKLNSRGSGMVAGQEIDTAIANQESARVALTVSESALVMAKADLEEATVSLGYTTIRSPVRGVVLDRRVTLGQTVSAGQGSGLFLIARDLGRMEIWSSVNETDIGSIHKGQKVRFTVSSLPRETFEGEVSQIRLNASMVQNVVTYTVVVSVDNSAGKLLPYLTARLQFEVEGRSNVLQVPNAALRWQPRVQNVAPEAREEYSELLRRRPAAASAETAKAGTAAERQAEGILWTRIGDFVRPNRVQIGLSDGVITEVRGGAVKEGDAVVTGATQVSAGADALSILPHTWTESKK